MSWTLESWWRCHRKQQHKSARAAQRVMDRINRSGNADVYKCDYCGMWHWGHYKPLPKGDRQDSDASTASPLGDTTECPQASAQPDQPLAT